MILLILFWRQYFERKTFEKVWFHFRRFDFIKRMFFLWLTLYEEFILYRNLFNKNEEKIYIPTKVSPANWKKDNTKIFIILFIFCILLATKSKNRTLKKACLYNSFYPLLSLPWKCVVTMSWFCQIVCSKTYTEDREKEGFVEYLHNFLIDRACKEKNYV